MYYKRVFVTRCILMYAVTTQLQRGRIPDTAWTVKVGFTYQNLRNILCFYILLEIKPCGLGSRIRDMEAESHN